MGTKTIEKKRSEEIGKNKDRIQTEFLLREHEYFAESFVNNEEVGEKRVNFLITIVLAILAALVGLVSVESTIIDLSIVLMVGIFVLFGLLLLSYVTLLRIIYRNKRTDDWKYRLDTVREQFRTLDKRLEDYYPFGRKIQRRTGFREFGTGGLVEFTMTIITILFIALVEFILANIFLMLDMFLSIQMTGALIIGFLGSFSASWYGLRRYVSSKYEERKEQMFEWRIFWSDDEERPWKEDCSQYIDNILSQAEVEKRTDYYINLGKQDIGLKITCQIKKEQLLCMLELKQCLGKKQEYEEWLKPVSLNLKTNIEDGEKNVSSEVIKGLEEILNSLDSKNPKEKPLFKLIRECIHQILIGKFQIVTITKERKRVRAYLDQELRSWQFQLSYSKQPETVILESTAGTLFDSSKEPKRFRTVCVESENVEEVREFRNSHMNDEFKSNVSYPRYLHQLWEDIQLK